MKFMWPQMLWLLAALPALAAAYFALLHRKKAALRYANFAAVVEATTVGQRVRRHVPPALLLGALMLLGVAVARPTAVIPLPQFSETVILAVDVSASMRAADVAPDRMTAAQEAAISFVRDQPRSMRTGIVEYSSAAALVHPPTTNRDDLVSAIEKMRPQRATAIGSGILVSLRALFPDTEFELNRSAAAGAVRPQRTSLRVEAAAADERFEPVEPGSNRSSVIILLTDGENTTGPDPVQAAGLAADRGVRVYTVGIGTPEGQQIDVGGWKVHVRLDEATLKKVSEITRGEYFHAASASELKSVYQALNSRLSSERVETEMTAVFSAGAAMLTTLAGLLSLLWFNRFVS